MNPTPTPEQIDMLARRRAGAKLGWYLHATVYVLVNLGLILLASQGAGHRSWPVYPALGWGLGLLLHGVSVFVLGKGSALRERLVQQERERLMRQHHRGGGDRMP